MKLSRIVLASSLILTSISAHADWRGTLSGRSANPANSPSLSVEGSFTTSGDYQNIGARINYDVNEALTIYGDFGQSEFLDDGTSFGAGVFYYLSNLSGSDGFLSDKDVAVQASYHTSSLDGRGFDIDFSSLGAALLLSPKNAFNPDNGMNWYANAGFTRLAFDVPRIDLGFGFVAGGGSEDSIELQLGGGIYLPMGPGTLYAGADLIDEFIFGVGYRYGIQ